MKKLFPLTTLLLLVSFITLSAAPDNKNVIKFALLADLHISDVATNIEDLRLSVADLNSFSDLDFVIFGGDITEFGSDEEIALAHKIISELRVPWYIVAGNHDAKWSESGCNTFKDVFGYEWFDFEVGGVRFLGCNSGPNMRMAPALVPRDAVLWLDSLSRRIPPTTPVVFVNHYPLDDGMLNYSQILTSLSRLNIQMVLCGHGHNNRAYTYKVASPASSSAASSSDASLGSSSAASSSDTFSSAYLPQTTIRGVMGRSNLRAGKGAHGYNLVTIDKTSASITFEERVGGETKKPWHSLKMNTPLPRFAVTELFNYQDNADIGSAAIMDSKGVIYWVNANGEVKAFASAAGKAAGSEAGGSPRDAARGASPRPLWSFTTGSKVFSTPAISGNKLIYGATDTYIYCLDKNNGKLLWKTKANKSVLSSPTIHNNIVYIGASDGIFRALDVNTGKPIWEYVGVKGFVESKPFVDNDGVYFGSWGSTFYKLHPQTGELLWSWTNNKGRGLSPAAVWPLVANGKVFIATPERMTHALDAQTGKELWRAKGGRESVGLSPDHQALYIKTMQDTVFSYRTTISNTSYNATYTSHANPNATPNLQPSPTVGTNQQSSATPNTIPLNDTLTRLWTSHTGYGYEIAPSPITSAYGYIFIPTDKGNIFVLNQADGTLAGVIPFSIALINLVQPVGNNSLLISSMDGRVSLMKIK